MQSLSDTIEHLGGDLIDVAGCSIPRSFARPRRSHQAVRNGVGVTVHPRGILVVAGEDRGPFLDDTLTCSLPPEEGEVRYGFLLDPDGQIEADLYLVHAGERFLCLTAPGTAGDLADTLGARTFIQDVTIEDATDEHAVLGVHGPASSTKLTSVMPDGTPPTSPGQMTRGVIREHGVTLVGLDAPTGESGIAVICRRDEAGAVFDALVSLGSMAAPVGYETWQALTLEAGTPSFDTELEGRTPNVCGQLHVGVDLEKGCFVGQEVVARITNRGEIRSRLVGLVAESLPAGGATVSVDGSRPGELTRTTDSPALDAAIGLAVVPADLRPGSTVSVGEQTATVKELPVVETAERSGRVPYYPGLSRSDG